jgi:hypothetical protein
MQIAAIIVSNRPAGLPIFKMSVSKTIIEISLLSSFTVNCIKNCLFFFTATAVNRLSIFYSYVLQGYWNINSYFDELKEQCNGGEQKYGSLENFQSLKDNLVMNCIPDTIFSMDIDNYAETCFTEEGLRKGKSPILLK